MAQPSTEANARDAIGTLIGTAVVIFLALPALLWLSNAIAGLLHVLVP